MRIVVSLVLACAVVLAMLITATAQPRRDGDRGGRGTRGGDTTIIHNYNRGGERGGRSYYRDRRPGYRYESSRGWYDPSAVVGGAIGGWLWRQFAQPEPPPPPQVIVVPQQPVRDVAWCMNRYKSYDPQTRTYLSYSGQYVACP